MVYLSTSLPTVDVVDYVVDIRVARRRRQTINQLTKAPELSTFIAEKKSLAHYVRICFRRYDFCLAFETEG